MEEIGQYSFPSITQEVIDKSIEDLKIIYKHNITWPGLDQQTPPFLFHKNNPRYGENWEILRDTFLRSTFNFTGYYFNNYKAWSFACFPNTECLQRDWHSHLPAKYSAILYLSLPPGSETTEFVRQDGSTFYLPPKLQTWFTYDGAFVHRNGYWDYKNINDYRFVIAASAW
jgi:hypothetical protein